MSAHRWASSVAVGLSTLLLASCGGEPPEAKPLDLQTKTDKTSRTSTIPSDPKAFIKHFVSLINTARETGDPEPFVVLSHPKCKSCDSMAKFVTAVERDGGRFQGEPAWDVKNITKIEGQEVPTFTVNMAESAYEVVEKRGAEPRKVPERFTFSTFKLKRDGSGWTMRDFFVTGER